LRVPHLCRSGRLLLDEAASRYVARVHRLEAGARLELFDPEAALRCAAVVSGIERRGVWVDAEPPQPVAPSALRRVTLLQSLGKGDKLDEVVRDATALGVSAMVTVASERSVVRLDEEGGERRRARWRRIAVETARQCGRGELPVLEGPLDFGSALRRSEGLTLMLAPEAPCSLREALERAERTQPLGLLIGPEGGWSERELAAASAAGVQGVRLGQWVLRTELAATAALAAVLALSE